MNLLEKLDALKASTGDNNASLAKNAGVPATTIYGLYQKGYTNMKLSTLQAISDYFNVSLDYLAKDDEKKPAITDGPSDLESRFMEMYARLDAEGRDLVDCYLSLPSDRRHLLAVIAKAILSDPSAPPDPQRPAL